MFSPEDSEHTFFEREVSHIFDVNFNPQKVFELTHILNQKMTPKILLYFHEAS